MGLLPFGCPGVVALKDRYDPVNPALREGRAVAAGEWSPAGTSQPPMAGTACTWMRRNEWKVTPVLSRENFGDPKTGAAGDADFIAALSSVLFVGSHPLALQERDGEPGTYLIRFYDHERTTGPAGPWRTEYEKRVQDEARCTVVAIDAHLLVADETGRIAWATHRTDDQEIWPGLYEKAYGAFRSFREKGLFGENCASLNCHESAVPETPLSRPPWSCTPESLPPFSHGVLPIFHLAPYTGFKFVTPPYTSELTQICDDTGRATKPALSWTNEGFLPGWRPGAKVARTYSVLGLYPDRASPTHVVLRDPACEEKGPAVKAAWNGIPLNTGDGIITVDTGTWEKSYRMLSYCY